MSPVTGVFSTVPLPLRPLPVEVFAPEPFSISAPSPLPLERGRCPSGLHGEVMVTTDPLPLEGVASQFVPSSEMCPVSMLPP